MQKKKNNNNNFPLRKQHDEVWEKSFPPKAKDVKWRLFMVGNFANDILKQFEEKLLETFKSQHSHEQEVWL